MALVCGEGGSTTQEVFNAINAIDFLSVDEMINLLVVDFLINDSVNVKGYYIQNDGGGGLFNYDSTIDKSTANSGTIIDPSVSLALQGTGVGLGCWVRQNNETISLISFGAKGDGITDDTVAINIAINAGISVLSGGGHENVYLCDQLNFTNKITIIGSGCKFLMRTADIIHISVEANDVRFENVIFDGNDKNVYQTLVAVRLIGSLGATGFAFIDCVFQNIIGSNVFDRDQWGLQVASDGARGRISGCTFRNISNTNTVGTTNHGFNGGLFIVGGDDPTANPSLGSDEIIVDNCSFYNMWTDNIAGDWTLSATDAIRVATQQSLGSTDGEIDFGLMISNIYMKDIQKTGIKISGAKGVKISNVEIDGPRRGGDTIQMLAAIRLQSCDSCIVTSLKMKARTQFIFNIKSSDVIIDGVQFQPQLEVGQADGITTAAFNFQSTDGDNTKNIVISNVQAELVRKTVLFDLSGITEPSYAFHDITFNNIQISHIEASSTALSVEADRVDGLTFNNCQFLDKFDNVLEIFQFKDSKRININNCYGEFRRSITHFVASVLNVPIDVNDVTIQNSKFVRPDTQASDNIYSSLVLKNSNDTSIKNIKVNNIEVSVPSYDTTANQTIVSCNLEKSSIEGLKMTIRDVSVAAPATALFGTFNECLIDGITLKTLGVVTGSTYAVQDDASSSLNSIYNIRSDIRGVRLVGDKTIVSNIGAWTSSINDTGTGNVSGSSIVYT